MVLSRTGVDVMSEQYFTRPNVQPVITNIGTTPEQRQMSTSEFKAKFDEMPEAIQQYIKETLLTELDAFKQEFMTHQADTVTDNVHGLQDRFKDAQIIKSSIGGDVGVVIDMDLEPGFYLLLISRDNAMYYIGVWGNAGTISAIIPMAGSSYEISITGKRLLVDFQTRTRGYILLKVS